MIRLDRFLSNMGRGTRKEVKKMISEGAVTVNGIPAADCAMAVDEQNDQVFVCSERVFYRPFVYLTGGKYRLSGSASIFRYSFWLPLISDMICEMPLSVSV